MELSKELKDKVENAKSAEEAKKILKDAGGKAKGIEFRKCLSVKNSEGRFELDLVLRNNITTDEHPMGVYHPHAEYHHIKKENIGLIEVMGLAVLPARLKNEMALLEDALLEGKDTRADETIAKHADWIDEWKDGYDLSSKDSIHNALQIEIGKTFAKILGCAGVYKNEEDFMRFVDTL